MPAPRFTRNLRRGAALLNAKVTTGGWAETADDINELTNVVSRVAPSVDPPSSCQSIDCPPVKPSVAQFRAMQKPVSPNDANISRQMRKRTVDSLAIQRVSKYDHRPNDILYHRRALEFSMAPTATVSGHPCDVLNGAHFMNIPFHDLPAANNTRRKPANRIWSFVGANGAELMVLLHYRRTLANDLSGKLVSRSINIHRLFRWSFTGPKPCHPASPDRMNSIGAAARYIKSELNSGAISAQEVTSISHRDTLASLVSKGRKIERRVLVQAL